VGYGAQGLATRHPINCIVLYLVPLLGMAVGLADINGFSLSSLFRRAPPPPQEATA
jgi:hypothetical protein